MKRLAHAFLFAVLTFAMATPGCSWFQKNPVIPAVVTCSGETISATLVQEVYTDILTENWGDLALVAVPALSAGWADVVCIYDALKTANPALVGHMEKLEAAHVELRAAVSLRSTGAPTLEKISLRGGPVAGQRPHTPSTGVQVSPPQPFAYAGENPGTALARCESACGGEALAPPSGCLCRSGRSWVAAR